MSWLFLLRCWSLIQCLLWIQGFRFPKNTLLLAMIPLIGISGECGPWNATPISLWLTKPGRAGWGIVGFLALDAPRDEVLCTQEETVKWLSIDTTSRNGIYPDKPVRIKENVRMRSPRLYDLLVVEW